MEIVGARRVEIKELTYHEWERTPNSIWLPIGEILLPSTCKKKLGDDEDALLKKIREYTNPITIREIQTELY